MKKADMIKNKIIHLTKDIMFEQGYDLVSIREIAKKASLNIAAVNYYFLNKNLGQTVTFSDSNARQRISWHLQGIIDQSLFLLRNSGEGKHLPVRESLRKTAQEFGERLDFKKSLKEEKQMALIQ